MERQGVRVERQGVRVERQGVRVERQGVRVERQGVRVALAAATVAVVALAMAAPARADTGSSSSTSSLAAPSTPSPVTPPVDTSVEVGYTQNTVAGPVVRTVHAADRREAVRVVESLSQRPDVVAANIAVPMRRLDVSRSSTIDPLARYQWALSRFGVPPTWTLSQGGGVVVAVIDDGIDRSHPDLQRALLRGRNILSPARDVDPGRHGTHVAGIIAARAGNGIGGAGLAPRATILPVDVFDGDSATDVSVAAGIVWAAKQPGVSIMSLSLGGPDSTDVLRQAIRFAQARGILVVAAAGNDGGFVASYPASYSGVLGVGAIGLDTTRAAFSSRGGQVDVMAPGVDVLSTSCLITASNSLIAAPSDDCTRTTTGAVRHAYEYMSGTSMATPFVSAAAALLKARYPRLTAAQLAAALQSTARDLGVPGRDSATGSGLVQPLPLLRGSAGAASRVTATSNGSDVTVRWRQPTWPGATGIGSWAVWFSSDNGATWPVRRSLPFAGNTCLTDACSVTVSRPAGTVVQTRVLTIAPGGALGKAATASVWHSPDAGDTVDTAQPLTAAVEVSGVIRYSSDEDWYSIDRSGDALSPFGVSVLGGVSGQVADVFAVSGGVIDRADPIASVAVGDPAGLWVDPSLLTGSPTSYIVVVSGAAAPLTPYRITFSPAF